MLHTHGVDSMGSGLELGSGLRPSARPLGLAEVTESSAGAAGFQLGPGLCMLVLLQVARPFCPGGMAVTQVSCAVLALSH